MSSSPENGACSTCKSPWRLVLLLAIVLAAILLTQSKRIRQEIFTAPAMVAAEPKSAAPSATSKVLLTINFGDGRLQNETADWRRGMTVADVLQQVPGVSLQSSGTGEAALLTSLNGITNEGAGGRNWSYSINGKYADRSFAVFELRPNDHVLWTFAAAQ